MEASQSTSRQEISLVSKFKGLLTRGWRERWNEIQWGIHVMRTIKEAELGQKNADVKEPVDTRELAGIHPFPHATNLQQTNLETCGQKYRRPL